MSHRETVQFIGEATDQAVRLINELREDLKLSAKNLIWMCERVHQGHHEHGHWKECQKGVCGSMEYMLAQVGFDKDLNKVEKQP